MRLKTLTKISVCLSVILFCVAVGWYGLARLAMANRQREKSLYEYVPQDCWGVMESDNVHFYLGLLPQMAYAPRLDQTHTMELFNYIFGGLDDYATTRAHGLSSQMSRLLVSFHAPGTPRDQVVYFRTGIGEDKILTEMLQERLKSDFHPKKEKYRGKTLVIYPLNDQDFLTTYAADGMLAVSYQKRLIEQVIDAKADAASLHDDPVFTRARQHKKSRHYLTVYARGTALPSLEADSTAWTEYDLHFNSDVVYLSGDIHLADSTVLVRQLQDCLLRVPDIKADSVILSARRDSVTRYITDAYNREEGAHHHELFNECVAGMSTDALFMLVADMYKVSHERDAYRPYIPPFFLATAPLFDAFIYSSQLSIINGRLSHIIMLTYKE